MNIVFLQLSISGRQDSTYTEKVNAKLREGYIRIHMQAVSSKQARQGSRGDGRNDRQP